LKIKIRQIRKYSMDLLDIDFLVRTTSNADERKADKGHWGSGAKVRAAAKFGGK
jgi:hypothetical protein